MRRVKRIVLTGHEQRAVDAIWCGCRKPNGQAAQVTIPIDYDTHLTISADDQDAFRRRFAGKSATITLVYDPEK